MAIDLAAIHRHMHGMEIGILGSCCEFSIQRQVAQGLGIAHGQGRQPQLGEQGAGIKRLGREPSA